MAENVDPNTFFNIKNIGSKPAATDEPKDDNVFNEFEHHLNLPMGSTQEMVHLLLLSFWTTLRFLQSL